MCVKFFIGIIFLAHSTDLYITVLSYPMGIVFIFVCSSRPNSAVLADDPSTDEHLTAMSPQRLLTSAVDNDTRCQPAAATADTVDVTADIAISLIYHSSDFALTPVSDTTKVHCCSLLFYSCYCHGLVILSQYVKCYTSFLSEFNVQSFFRKK